MLSSRYLHLHEALGLGPMWLLRGAAVRPADAAVPRLQPQDESAAVPHLPEAEEQAMRTLPPVLPAQPHDAAVRSSASVPAYSAEQSAAAQIRSDRLPERTHRPHSAEPPAVRERRASPQAAALLEGIRRQESGAAPQAEREPCESPLEQAERLWAALPESAPVPAADCTACKLHQERRQVLAGRGAAGGLLVLSLNPSLHDDDTGGLFSGSHGRLLDNMLAAIGLQPQQVFRTSWLRCTPRLSLRPDVAEQIACAAYLRQEFAQVRPRAVLLLGDSFADEVQQWLVARVASGTPCFRVPHPAVLLRQPQLKAQAWAVLRRLRPHLASADG